MRVWFINVVVLDENSSVCPVGVDRNIWLESTLFLSPLKQLHVCTSMQLYFCLLVTINHKIWLSGFVFQINLKFLTWAGILCCLIWSGFAQQGKSFDFTALL